MRRICSALALTLVACGDPAADPADATSPAADARAPVDATATVDGSHDADAAAVPEVRTAVVSTTHRYAPGAMFGGWGPHLGHLVRSPDGRLFLVDDGCDQGGGPQGCDATLNRRLEYYELVGDAWQARAALALPTGIQQNTGTVAHAGGLASFGIDVSSWRLVECRMDPSSWSGSCAPLPLTPLPAGSNYVGAALSPDGYVVAWATTVADGGGGSFHWYVDYGGGWNGPRSGGVGGYNDASYVNIAFGAGASSSQFVMHAQLVSGLAPSWGFHAAVADGDAATATAVSFALLGPAGDDPLVSTNDVVVDPVTGDTHLLARTESGAVAYVHRPAGGGFAAPASALPATYRARWIALADDTLVLVYGRNGAGLFYRRFPVAARAAGVALDIAAAPERSVALPPGYETIYAIYPESSIYQATRPTEVNVALVGAEREHELLHVAIEGL